MVDPHVHGTFTAREGSAADLSSVAKLTETARERGCEIAPPHTLLLARALGWLHLLDRDDAVAGFAVVAPCNVQGEVVIRDLSILPPHDDVGSLIDAVAALLRLPKFSAARFLRPGATCDEHVCVAMRTASLLADYLIDRRR